MKTITVNSSKTCDIIVGTGILKEAGVLLRKISGGQAAAIVTDDNVAGLYGGQLVRSLERSGYRTAQFVFPHGESSKNAATFVSLLDFLANEKFSRTDVVVAFGGGVTGDLAGFAASCYMRGIRFVQIPTTLLAAVDSSVGGKTAINLSAGKNLAGAFYQPDFVLCDVSLLSTLPEEVYRDGCSEVIKYGAIFDRVLFESLRKPVNQQYENIIERCVELKRDIVNEDEFETGRRKLLNFGHTIGHAVEQLSGYTVSHGNAVAAGMAVITRAAVRMGICEESCLREILDMLALYELPANTAYNAGTLANVCLSDKKRSGETISMIFPLETGNCIIKDVASAELENIIRLGLEEFRYEHTDC